MEQYKTCSKCKQTKSIDEFGIHKQTKDGLYSQCQPCRRQARAEYRKRHVEKIKAEQRDNYLRNRQKRIAYASKNVANNRERHRQYNSISKKRNKEQVAASTRKRNATKKIKWYFFNN